MIPVPGPTANPNPNLPMPDQPDVTPAGIVEGVAFLLESEAGLADRPGQMGRLEKYAADLRKAAAGLLVAAPAAQPDDEALLDRYRAASLSYEDGDDDCDYIGAAGPVPDDEDEHALANITEMHRVLGVRMKRLFKLHDQIKQLESELADAAAALAALRGKQHG